MIPTPHTVQVLPFKPGEPDSHGNPTRAWGEPVEYAVYGWDKPNPVEPKLAGHDRVVVDIEVFAPESIVVGPDDRMVVNGQTYDVIGEVEDWNHGPWRWRPGVVVNLRRVDG